MGRQVNPNVPEAGYVSKEQFENTGSIAGSDFAVVADKDNTKKIAFDPSALTTGASVTFVAGAGSGAVVLTLPTTNGTLSTGGGGATTALDNLASVAVNVDVNPGVSGVRNIGSPTKIWSDFYVGNIKDTSSVAVLQVNNRVLADPTGTAMDFSSSTTIFPRTISMQAGQLSHTRSATSTPVTVVSTDFYVGVNVASASVVNLPAGIAGTRYIIADISGAADVNNITINASGADKIVVQGNPPAASITLSATYQGYQFIFLSGNWFSVGSF